MSNTNIDNTCPYCETAMKTTRMCCQTCAVSVEADFPDQPLARLPTEHQRFIEIFVLAGGSLKEIATQAGVSYPTVRSRLDRVIESLTSVLEGSQPSSKKGKKSTSQSKAAEILKQI